MASKILATTTTPAPTSSENNNIVQHNRFNRNRRTRFANQSYRKLVKKYKDCGLTFTDDQFRSADGSVYQSTAYRHRLDIGGRVLWKRPKEILAGELLDHQQQYDTTNNIKRSSVESLLPHWASPSLLPQGTKWSNVELNSAAFCFSGPNQWLIGAALALTLHRSLVTTLLHTDEECFRRTGIVKWILWHFGVWQKVVVDDKLPVDCDSRLIFTKPAYWLVGGGGGGGGSSSSSSSSPPVNTKVVPPQSTSSIGSPLLAFWLPMLEKAYAKLYGSYELMATHGSLITALSDFTAGGMVEQISLNGKTPTQTPSLPISMLIELIIKESSFKSSMLLRTKDFTTTTTTTGNGPFGLVSNRLYLIKIIKRSGGGGGGGTLRRFTNGLSPSSSSSATTTTINTNTESLITLINTIYEPSRSSSSFNPSTGSLHSAAATTATTYHHQTNPFAAAGGGHHQVKLQELTIPANEISKHFETLTICRPAVYAKERRTLERLMVRNIGGMQLCFDVCCTTNTVNGKISNDPKVDQKPSQQLPPQAQVLICLSQKSLTHYIPLGFRLHSIELNRHFRVHQFSTIRFIASFDPIHCRDHIQSIRLPVGRYLLTPICNETSVSAAASSSSTTTLVTTTTTTTPLMISIMATDGGGGSGGCEVHNLIALQQEMPRYQPAPFVAPRYPFAVSRLIVHRVEGLEKQDRFGSANPYCIVRCGSKAIRSYCITETLNPQWHNLSVVFYHKKMNIPIQVEIWHRSLLMDYFIGLVRLLPTIMSEEDSPPLPPSPPHNNKSQLHQKPQFDTSSSLSDAGDEDNEEEDEDEKEKDAVSNNKEDNDDQKLSKHENNHHHHSSSSTTTTKISDRSKNNKNIRKVQLTDKKGVGKRSGWLHFELYTYENLKYF